MTDHTVALVTIESWAFNSPDQADRLRPVDIGLFAEALIYYDRVLLNIPSPGQFAGLLEWLAEQGALPDFLALVRDGTITPYHYAFATMPINKNGVWSIWNVQGQDQVEPEAFERTVLYHPDVERAIPKGRLRGQLYAACRDRCIEIKSSQAVGVVENARRDIADAARSAVILQQYIDVLYSMRGLGKAPKVEATTSELPDTTVRTTWNIDFGQLSQIGGPRLQFHETLPIAAGATCNRLLWSARDQGCDLFVGSPMSSLVGDKLFETVKTCGRSAEILSEFKAGVDFPDVRAEVNQGNLSFADVLRIRRKAEPLRGWLQDASDRDLNALVAYHNEVARESGFISDARKLLRMFGWLAGGAAGAAVGNVIGGAAGAGLGAAALANVATEATQFLIDQASGVASGWRPVVFGDWTRDYIERVAPNR